MKNQLLTLRGTTVQAAEQILRSYMEGLDTRLTQVSPNQAILAGPHARALRSGYSKTGAAAILHAAGVVVTSDLKEADAVALVRHRDSDATIRPANFALVAGLDRDWYLDNTRTRGAWTSIGGAPDSINWNGLRIGHVDTGYSRHPAFGFEAAPWVDVADGETYFVPHNQGPVDPPPEPGHGIDPLVGGHNPGHGTKSGSTIVGKVGAIAYHGVAPGCEIVPVRICDTVLITDRQREFAKAVDHVLASGVSVITVCLGVWPGPPIAALRAAVDRAYEAGVIMVCAAGQYVGAVVAPAFLPRTIAVAGTTYQDVPWGHSCHGDSVDLCAPAADIFSAASKLKSGTISFEYESSGDGTTYATAMVSGAAALWLLHHGPALAQYTEPWQKVEAFKFCVRGSTRKPSGWPAGFGTGILNVDALLKAGLPVPTDLTKDSPAT